MASDRASEAARGDAPAAAPGEKQFSSSSLTVVVLGASGDLAKKKTLPALMGLFDHGLLPRHVIIMGYARSPMPRADFQERLKPFLKKFAPDAVAAFLDRCYYESGSYDSPDDFARLHTAVSALESAHMGSKDAHRLFYLALPPSIFATVSQCLRSASWSTRGWNRVIVEKPFGRDSRSSRELVASLAAIYAEHEQYRIDHYLGKEMVQNMLVLRFANLAFSSLWSRASIASVSITFKEPFGTEGRGGYFDDVGIIRDVMQNHLLQVLSLIAMERPISLAAEAVRDEKVKVLKCIRPVAVSDVVIGQYGRSVDGTKPGYLDDEGVPAGSLTPTFAVAALYVDNERWDGVPFFIKCGKALEERKAMIRIQFRDVPGQLFPGSQRNELVLEIQPSESIYLKTTVKEPGMSQRNVYTDLDLSYKQSYQNLTLPDAYENLIYDVVRGDHSNFVRADELEAAWAIFTPLLDELAAQRIAPAVYPYGSRGPEAAAKFAEERGYVRTVGYVWESRAVSVYPEVLPTPMADAKPAFA